MTAAVELQAQRLIPRLSSLRNKEVFAEASKGEGGRRSRTRFVSGRSWCCIWSTVRYPYTTMPSRTKSGHFRRVAAFGSSPTTLWAPVRAYLFTPVSSARANGLEPYTYLNYVFEHLPAADTVEALEALLPWNTRATLLPSQHPSDHLIPRLYPAPLAPRAFTIADGGANPIPSGISPQEQGYWGLISGNAPR
jgi:hypothetical protein